MKNRLIFVFIVYSVFLNMSFVFAQSENLTIIRESGIDQLVNKHLYYNEVQKTIPGYRIQIFSGSGNYSKGNAINERSKFMSRYPDIKTYIIFNTPYYIVRAGNFRTRLEAEAFRQKVIDHYPGVYLVRDDIDLPAPN